jgi:hypothetical protein
MRVKARRDDELQTTERIYKRVEKIISS